MTQPAASRPSPSHDVRDLFLRLWAKELATTRTVLERIPEGSDYRPDPKSRTAREIAWLIVREQIALVDGIERGEIRWTEPPAPATVAEVLALDDQHRTGLVDRLKALPVAAWDVPVPFTYEGNAIMTETGIDSAWTFLLDVIHHRGQLSTYLRAMGSTVPQIYGPSADEPMM
ncbi:MAG: DinB family protein [Vicinamibacteraceae bacterium]